MNWLEWLIALLSKALLVSATVLLSLISSGSLTAWLNELVKFLTFTGLDSNASLSAFVLFLIASAKFWPEIVGAIPTSNSTKATASRVNGVAEGMRII